MYTHLGRIVLEKGRNKNQKEEMLRKESSAIIFIACANPGAVCGWEWWKFFPKKGRTIAPEPITDTKLCERWRSLEQNGGSRAKIEKISYELKISCVGGGGRRNASFIGDCRVLSKHTLPKSLNFLFCVPRATLAAYRIIFFVRTRIEFINYAKYIFMHEEQNKKKSIATTFFTLTSSHLLLPRHREEIIFVHVTIPLS